MFLFRSAHSFFSVRRGTEIFQSLFLLSVDRKTQTVVIPTVQPQFTPPLLR